MMLPCADGVHVHSKMKSAGKFGIGGKDIFASLSALRFYVIRVVFSHKLQK